MMRNFDIARLFLSKLAANERALPKVVPVVIVVLVIIVCSSGIFSTLL